MDVPRLGVKPQLQLPGYATATATATPNPSRICDIHPTHHNAGSLNHWARPRIEPASPWILVRFLTHGATTGTPERCDLLISKFPFFRIELDSRSDIAVLSLPLESVTWRLGACGLGTNVRIQGHWTSSPFPPLCSFQETPHLPPCITPAHALLVPSPSLRPRMDCLQGPEAGGQTRVMLEGGRRG